MCNFHLPHLPSISFNLSLFLLFSPPPLKCFPSLFSFRTSLNCQVTYQRILKWKNIFIGNTWKSIKLWLPSLPLAKEELLIILTCNIELLYIGNTPLVLVCFKLLYSFNLMWIFTFFLNSFEYLPQHETLPYHFRFVLISQC